VAASDRIRRICEVLLAARPLILHSTIVCVRTTCCNVPVSACCSRTVCACHVTACTPNTISFG
jgi:hypothetical protein